VKNPIFGDALIDTVCCAPIVLNLSKPVEDVVSAILEVLFSNWPL
jgi:hypothetical protein